MNHQPASGLILGKVQFLPHSSDCPLLCLSVLHVPVQLALTSTLTLPINYKPDWVSWGNEQKDSQYISYLWIIDGTP